MIRNLANSAFLISICLTPAWGDETIVGYVKTTTPEAVLLTTQSSHIAQVGDPIALGTTIKTNANGSIGISLKDDTILSFGPDTDFQITEFVYQPEVDQLKLSMKLLNGTLQYISGIIAKLKPEAVSLNTPTGIIGVRGTHFVVKVAD